MKVLIIGAGGYLGGVLLKNCKGITEISVCGTYFSNPQDGLLRLDVMNSTATNEIVTSFDPDVVVWCLCDKVNEVDVSNFALRHILSIIKPTVRFIYISSTVAENENQNEETTPQARSDNMPLANYVNGKILGESLIKKHENHVIIRPGQIYGFDAKGDLDIRMKRVQQEIKQNDKYIRAANSLISVIHVDDLSACIIELFACDFVGTLCVASDVPVSYYSFYKFLATQIGISEYKIVPEYDYKSSNYFDTTKAKSIIKSNIRRFEI